MALNFRSVEGYIQAARRTLLDRVKPYRYTDTALLVGLNTALDEGSRTRPDLFISRGRICVPEYDVVSGEVVPIDRQFRQAFVYGLVAYTLLDDEEDVQDERANAFLKRMQDILLGVRQSPMPADAGTPTPQTPTKQAGS